MYKTLYSKYNIRYEGRFNTFNEVYIVDAYVEYQSFIGLCLRHILQIKRDGDVFTANILNEIPFGDTNVKRDNNIVKVIHEIEDIFNIKIGVIENLGIPDLLHPTFNARIHFNE